MMLKVISRIMQIKDRGQVFNILRDLHNTSYHTKVESDNFSILFVQNNSYLKTGLPPFSTFLGRSSASSLLNGWNFFTIFYQNNWANATFSPGLSVAFPFSCDILYYWWHVTRYRIRLPNLVNAGWFWRISRGDLSKLETENILNCTIEKRCVKMIGFKRLLKNLWICLNTFLYGLLFFSWP